MLKIRLTRIGRKHDPTYRLVVVDSRRATQSGAYLENLGFYNPRKVGLKKEPLMSDFKEKAERINYWISQGAQLSGTARNVLINAGVVKGEKANVSSLSKKKRIKIANAKKAEEVPTEKPSLETVEKEVPAEEAPRKEQGVDKK